jgi:uncharacterized Fe-S cluster-containing radical SAM superfamily protein
MTTPSADPDRGRAGRSRRAERSPLDPEKFIDPLRTTDGSERAFVDVVSLETLWFNTGSLCNIECRHCYMESSPANDRLAFLSESEVRSYLDEIERLRLPVREIGFTGGEPFMNPDFLEMTEVALERGFEVLVLTNAMRPLMRPAVRSRLLGLRSPYSARLHLRVSLDHYAPELHDAERGPGSWEVALSGLRWLASKSFRISVAGRTCWDEERAKIRRGYQSLFRQHGIPVDAEDPGQLILFPEMDATVDVPEITTGCWSILDTSPSRMMCARSRMVLKRRESRRPVVVACTLLPYTQQFELGSRLDESLGRVRLNHPHCATFCALGGGSCSVE